MSLKRLEINWDEWAKRDAMFAILTFDGKAGKWDAEEFFRSGREEIAQVLREADALLPQSPKKRALDFGCGIGRLTQALAEHFEESHSVDIAPTMIELAGEANQFGDKVHYHLNPKNDLSLFPDEYFDFVYSNIVLQHIHSEMSRRYIQEFLRVLCPGGAAVFQCPGRRQRDQQSLVTTAKATGKEAARSVINALSSVATGRIKFPRMEARCAAGRSFANRDGTEVSNCRGQRRCLGQPRMGRLSLLRDQIIK